MRLVDSEAGMVTLIHGSCRIASRARKWGLWPTPPLLDRLERAVLHKRAQVVCGGLPELLAQADHERLGELEEPVALSPAGGGNPGPLRHRLHHGVGLQVERPGTALGGEVLVLGQASADSGRLVAPAQERSPVEESGAR